MLGPSLSLISSNWELGKSEKRLWDMLRKARDIQAVPGPSSTWHRQAGEDLVEAQKAAQQTEALRVSSDTPTLAIHSRPNPQRDNRKIKQPSYPRYRKIRIRDVVLGCSSGSKWLRVGSELESFSLCSQQCFSIPVVPVVLAFFCHQKTTIRIQITLLLRWKAEVNLIVTAKTHLIYFDFQCLSCLLSCQQDANSTSWDAFEYRGRLFVSS